MSLSNDMSAVMPVAPAGAQNYGGQNCGGFNGDGAWWLIVLFLFIFAGGWNNGGARNGSSGGMTGGGYELQGLATRADISEGFAVNNLDSGIRAIQNGICQSTYDLNNSINNGFSADARQLTATAPAL